MVPLIMNHRAVQPMCRRYINVTDKRTDGRTEGRTTYDSSTSFSIYKVIRWDFDYYIPCSFIVYLLHD